MLLDPMTVAIEEPSPPVAGTRLVGMEGSHKSEIQLFSALLVRGTYASKHWVRLCQPTTAHAGQIEAAAAIATSSPRKSKVRIAHMRRSVPWG